MYFLYLEYEGYVELFDLLSPMKCVGGLCKAQGAKPGIVLPKLPFRKESILTPEQWMGTVSEHVKLHKTMPVNMLK